MDKSYTERAEELLGQFDYNVYYHHSPIVEDAFKDGYIYGAGDQEDIDGVVMKEAVEKAKHKMIEKACKWAKMQNYSMSVQLDLKRFLEE